MIPIFEDKILVSLEEVKHFCVRGHASGFLASSSSDDEGVAAVVIFPLCWKISLFFFGETTKKKALSNECDKMMLFACWEKRATDKVEAFFFFFSKVASS